MMKAHGGKEVFDNRIRKKEVNEITAKHTHTLESI